MKFPEGGPERFFVLTDRGSDGPPTIVFFKDWFDASKFASATDEREGGSTSSKVRGIWQLRIRAKMRARREAEWTGITFRPCPYCGKALTCHDVKFLDEAGPMLDESLVREELFLHALSISCDCGSAKVVSAEAVDWPKAGWRKRFADCVNMRAEAVQ